MVHINETGDQEIICERKHLENNNHYNSNALASSPYSCRGYEERQLHMSGFRQRRVFLTNEEPMVSTPLQNTNEIKNHFLTVRIQRRMLNYLVKQNIKLPVSFLFSQFLCHGCFLKV